LAEPAALAIPSVAQNTESYREVITHTVSGVLATTPAEWAEAVATLAADEDTRYRIGRSAQELLCHRFSFEKVGYAYACALMAAKPQ
jgi:glycosyltransferase involved in cell wall biosynthesis